MDSQQLAKQIEAARKGKGWTQKQAAAKAGLPYRTYWAYEKGEIDSPAHEKVQAIANALDLAILPVKNGGAEPGTAGGTSEEKPVEMNAGSMVAIALASVRGSAGEGEEAFQPEVDAYVIYDRSQLRRDTGLDPAKMVLIAVSGNSMEPTLRPGDRVLVYQYQGEPVMDGTIYVFSRQHFGVIVKRVFWTQEGCLELRSDNPTGPTLVITPGEEHEWKVIGKVLRVEKAL